MPKTKSTASGKTNVKKISPAIQALQDRVKNLTKRVKDLKLQIAKDLKKAKEDGYKKGLRTANISNQKSFDKVVRSAKRQFAKEIGIGTIAKKTKSVKTKSKKTTKGTINN